MSPVPWFSSQPRYPTLALVGPACVTEGWREAVSQGPPEHPRPFRIFVSFVGVGGPLGCCSPQLAHPCSRCTGSQCQNQCLGSLAPGPTALSAMVDCRPPSPHCVGPVPFMTLGSAQAPPGGNKAAQAVATFGDVTAMERLYRTCRQGLLGVLFVMANDGVAEKRWRAWFLIVFHMLQVGG